MKGNNAKYSVILIFTLAIGVSIGGTLIHSAQASGQDVPPALIRAQQFQLVNKDGKTLAVLGSDELGTALEMFDENGQRGFFIRVTPKNERFLVVIDAEHQTTVELRAGKDAMIRLAEAKSKKAKIIEP